MSYSTKEFCKLCDVGREALRLYERLGLISPRINSDNRYRMYDAWDASKIAEIKHYQALGLSLKEISGILNNSDLQQTVEYMENSVSMYKDRIRYYQMLCKKTEEELRIMHKIPEMFDQYASMVLPDLVFVMTPEIKRDGNPQEKTSFMQFLDFFMPCIRIDEDYSGDESRQDYSGWGVLLKKEYADFLKISGGITLPSSHVLCTVIDAGEKGTLSKKLFENFLSRLEQESPLHPITIYGALLTRTHDNTGDYHRYLFTFAFISEASGMIVGNCP